MSPRPERAGAIQKGEQPKAAYYHAGDLAMMQFGMVKLARSLPLRFPLRLPTREEEKAHEIRSRSGKAWW